MDENLKVAKAAAAKNFERAQQQLADDEKRLADARRDVEKKRLVVRKADPDHSSFEKSAAEAAVAEKRLEAFEQRVVDAHARVELAIAESREASIAANLAEIEALGRDIVDTDAALLRLVLETERDGRAALRKIYALIE